MTKETRIYNVEKIVSHKCFWENFFSCRRMKLHVAPYSEINSKWIRLECKILNRETPRRNIDSHLIYFGLSSIFLNMSLQQHRRTWKVLMLTEISQTEKTPNDFTHMWNPKNKTNGLIENKLVVAKGKTGQGRQTK